MSLVAAKRVLKFAVCSVAVLVGIVVLWVFVVGFRIYGFMKDRPQLHIPQQSKTDMESSRYGELSIQKVSRDQKNGSVDSQELAQRHPQPPLEDAKEKKRRKRNLKETYKLIVLSSEILEAHPEFDPCESVCKESEFKKKCQRISIECFKDFYVQRGEGALSDPAFNLALLAMSNMGEVVPPDLMQLIDRWGTGDKSEWLKTKILVRFPLYVSDLTFRMDSIRTRFEAVKGFTKAHKQCRSGELNSDMAKLRCQQDFRDRF